MHPAELFNELKKRKNISSDAELAQLIGLTGARISQMRLREDDLTARQLANYIGKAEARGRRIAYNNPIIPGYPVIWLWNAKVDARLHSLGIQTITRTETNGFRH